MATNFSLYKDATISHAPSDLRSPLTTMLTKLPSPNEGFLGDAFWDRTKSKQWVIKCSETNLEHIKKINKDLPNSQATSEAFYAVVNGYKIKFQLSRKKTAGGVGADAVTTRKQELGSAWIMQRAMKDNMKYTQYQDIVKDPKYYELQEIYPEITEEWVKIYFLQQQRMLQEYSNPQFTVFNREGGFMKYITDLVKSKYGISQKDTWDPADIWLIKDVASVMRDLDKVTSGGKSQTLTELNSTLRTMFKQRRVIGVSLKKVSGQQAQYEEVNVNDGDFVDMKNYNFSVTEMRIDLSLRSPTSFQNQETKIVVFGGDQGTFNFQIKGNDSVAASNLKFEPTMKEASAARIGKAPVDMVLTLCREYGFTFDNNHKNYPKTAEEFEKKKNLYKQMFSRVSISTLTRTNVATVDDFVKNMIAVLNGKDRHVATAKLMQLTFLNSILSLPKEKMESFMTDMTFLAMKKGDKFGPFGKLY